MADPARRPLRAPATANDEPPTVGAPRWAKVFGVTALIVIVGFIALRLTVFGGM